jgi:glycosyltransferase involved in cell wall biosynthesis
VSDEWAKEITAHYDISYEYFYLPNQFWVHKNHQIVIKALNILKKMGKKVLVAASGLSEDYRAPGYYQQLCDLIKKYSIDAEFRYLGMIPYEHVLALMKESIAVINPSFFEGWSSTVEEAKSMGKLLLLSDIVVHREQAPPEGRYFDPNDETMLAEAMLDTIRQYDKLKEYERKRKAASQLTERINAFGDQYESYVVECLENI